MSFKRICCACAVMIAMLMILSNSSYAQENNKKFVFYSYGDLSRPETKIVASKIAGENTIVLPAASSAESVVLHVNTTNTLYVSGSRGSTYFVSGDTLNLKELCYENDYVLLFYGDLINEENTGSRTKRTMTFYPRTKRDLGAYKLRIRFSEKLPAVYLNSEDPVSKGRQWVEYSYDKSNQAKGSIFMQSPSGRVVHNGALTQIKGRGNTTWGLPKKPYQIKLENKTDLLETGDKDNKNKTWILLANHYDPVGLRNTLALNLGAALGMPTNIEGKSVDLYYDGEYRGMYMLTEKVEIDDGRVEVTDLEKSNEDANANVKLKSFPIASATTKNGATYTYCKGMKSPKDITGGYLLEMDFEVRAVEEVCYFKTKRGQHVVVKSPEYASKDEMEYISTLYQEYEDSVYEGGVNSQTGKKYSDYVDARSVACYFLVNEFSKARDCFQSSAYLYKDSSSDKLYMGPLWDYDMSFGKAYNDNYQVEDTAHGVTMLDIDFCVALLKIDEFHDLTKNIYQNEMVPLITNVILGDKDAKSDNGSLRSLKYYFDLVGDSGVINTDLWYENKPWNNEATKLYNFINERHGILSSYYKTYSNITKAPTIRYLDVWYGHSNYYSIMEASHKGLLQGTDSRNFSPDAVVSRAEAAQVFYSLAGKPSVTYKAIYNDVLSGKAYSSAVVWAYENNVFVKHDDGKFNPHENIRREDFIDAIYRYVGSPGVNIELLNSYTDGYTVNKKNAVEWALKSGILPTYNNYINPYGTVSRADMAVILTKLYK